MFMQPSPQEPNRHPVQQEVRVSAAQARMIGQHPSANEPDLIDRFLQRLRDRAKGNENMRLGEFMRGT
jgi:hypothetical protein